MLFYVKYQVDRDKQSDTQAFFANMSEEDEQKRFQMVSILSDAGMICPTGGEWQSLRQDRKRR